MSLSIGGREVENIAQCPGEASTIANFIMTSEVEKRTYGQISGWIPDVNKGDTDVDNNIANDANQGYYWRKKIYNSNKKYRIMFPLKSIFGFTEYNKIVYLIKISLSLIRKDNNVLSDEIFYGVAGTTGKINFETLEWWIPSIKPSLEVEELIEKRLGNTKPIDVTFMKRSMGEITIPKGTKFSWKLGNVSNSVRFIFIAFKKTDAPSAQANNSLFKCSNGADEITSLRIQMNNTYYPIDRMQFKFSNYNIAEPYMNYVNACLTFGNHPQLSVQEFKDLYPIFVFDTSSQDEKLKTNDLDITLHIEKSSGVTLQGYSLLLENCQFTIDVGKGSMLRLN
jgi:hypothetical protein